MQNLIEFPSGWGNDTLSNFQKGALLNEFTTFANTNSWHTALSAVADDLQNCSTHAFSSIPTAENPAASLLFMTAHNFYLASSRLVTSGHCLPIHPICRAGIEAALYGWYIARHPDAGDRWHNKPADHKALKAWNDEFRFSSLTRALSKSNKEAAEWAKYMHQSAIDFGAHPNKNGIYSDISPVDLGNGRTALQMDFLNKWNNNSIASTKFVIETGIFSIVLFANAFPDADKMYGLFASIAFHRKSLIDLVEQSRAFVDGNLLS